MKSRFHNIVCHKSPEGEKSYSYTLSSTSALNGVGGQRQVPAAILLEKMTQYPWYRRLDAPQRRCGEVRKISPPTRLDPQIV